MARARYTTLLGLLGLLLMAGCDSGSSDDDGPAPPPVAPFIRYEVTAFGDYAANEVRILYYTDAAGDTVKLGFNRLPWSTTFFLDPENHDGSTDLYLYTVTGGPLRKLGHRLVIYVDGYPVKEQARDGIDANGNGSSTLYAQYPVPR